MTVDTLPAEAPSTDSDTPDILVPSAESTSPESTPAPDAPAARRSRRNPGRKVVTGDARPLFERGGGIHCITQNQPSARSAA